MSETTERPAKEERRREILDAAFQEFTSKGYAGASMEAIARRARASKETLYAWFENKERLFNTLLTARLEGISNRVTAAAVADPPMPLTAKVTVPIVSPICNPLLAKSVLPLPKTIVCPYVLLCALAVTVSGAGLTTRLTVLVALL